jgi:murein DD-endopeptidase MepM/ murein hydrolase activator NlpD
MRVVSTPTRSRATYPVRDPMASTHLLRRSKRRRGTFVVAALPALATLRPIPVRAALARLGHERTVAVAVAAIVLGASFLSVAPAGAGGDTGGPTGDGSSPRLGIGGTLSSDDDISGRVEAAYADQSAVESADAAAYAKPALAANARPRLEDLQGPDPAAQLTQASIVEGPFLDDGTLLKPVAVNTSVADGSALIRTYKVKAGDTLAGIAAKFDVSTMTLWWANKLKAKNALVRGQELKIPPVSGLVIEVKTTDTLASLARRYKVAEDEILATNQLEDPHLVVGQVLVLPDAKGAPIATKPRPSRAPVRSGTSGSSGGSPVRAPRTYSGGNFLWPTTSHHISQYFHYGHYAIDIDGNTGDPIWAAAAGTVTFSGWKNNGGGYQVWISHGSGLYTTYNHMSSVSVARGQHVSRGQRVGRMGATGFATGSHLHFEVWKGPIWNGGTRVNPLAYL